MVQLRTRRRLLQTLWAASGAAALHALVEAFRLRPPAAADDMAGSFRARLPWVANQGRLSEPMPTGLAPTATPTATL